jgi:hypothetical protein
VTPSFLNISRTQFGRGPGREGTRAQCLEHLVGDPKVAAGAA